MLKKPKIFSFRCQQQARTLSWAERSKMDGCLKHEIDDAEPDLEKDLRRRTPFTPSPTLSRRYGKRAEVHISSINKEDARPRSRLTTAQLATACKTRVSACIPEKVKTRPNKHFTRKMRMVDRQRASLNITIRLTIQVGQPPQLCDSSK